MNPYQKLTIITIVTATVSAIAVATSLLWKSSTEVAGQTRKRLTPAGRLLFGIALIGLLAAVASELIRVRIRNDDRLQAQAAAAQKQALLEQEERWRKEMKEMLEGAKVDIGKNLDNTIRGFQESQNRFNHTQAEIITSKQSVLESNVRHTNEIVVAGQPLTSLSFRWEFSSNSSALRNEMNKGEEAIDENAKDEQGNVPAVPYDVMEYRSALLPLLSHVARLGTDPKAEETTHSLETGDSIVVLIPLDESQNAILSFGHISGSEWYEDRGGSSLSDGFLLDEGSRSGNSTVHVAANLAGSPKRGISNYSIYWDLDPSTLANAYDRKNTAIAPMAKLPRILKVAIFYDVKVLPFQQKNFSFPYAVNIWNRNERSRKYLAIRNYISNAMFMIEVNGLQQTKYRYVLKRMYKLDLMDQDDDEIETGCTVLEFEAV